MKRRTFPFIIFTFLLSLPVLGTVASAGTPTCPAPLFGSRFAPMHDVGVGAVQASDVVESEPTRLRSACSEAPAGGVAASVQADSGEDGEAALPAVALNAPETSRSASGAWTLDDCIVRGLAGNLEVAMQQDSLQIVRWQNREARSRARPRLNLQNLQTHLHTLPGFGEVKIGVHDSNISKAVLQQPLYTFGRIKAGVDMLTQQQQAEEWGLRAKTQETVYDIVAAYLEVLKAMNRVTIASESLTVIREHLQLAETLCRAGVVLSTDVAATRVKCLETQQLLVEEENAVQINRERLANLLRLPSESLGALAQLAPGSIAPVAPASSSLQMAAAPPEIRRMDALLAALAHKRLIERRGHYPLVNLQATYETGNQFNDRQKNWNAVVVCDFPVFDSGATHARTRQVHHEIERTTSARAQVQQGLQLAIKTHYLKIQEIEKKIELACQALQTAQENLDQNLVNYREGSALNTDVLNAQLLLSNAKVTYGNAFYDYLRHQSALARHLGRLPAFLEETLGVTAAF